MAGSFGARLSLGGTVKKKLGLALVSETGKDGTRRYRLDDAAKAG